MAAIGFVSGFVSLGALLAGLVAVSTHVASAYSGSGAPPITSSVAPVEPAGGTPVPARREVGNAQKAEPPPGEGSPPSADKSLSDRVVAKRIGRIVLADVGPGVRSLDVELSAQRKLAEQRGETLLLWLVVDKCSPCESVAEALGDPLLQRALADVRIVRVDVRDFQTELRFLRVPVDKIPGFALLDEDNHPVDYLHGGEWDEDIAKNIAPVLGRFVRGTYDSRREPWRGGTREDETNL